MLDSDLADIYGYEVRYLNRQVKRNIERFPEDFMFQLSKEELNDLRCQNVTANINSKSRTLPYVFSEQGIYMLATVLKSELAVQQSIVIMRTFKNMRHYITENRQLASKEDLQRIAMTVDEYKEKTDKTIQHIEKRIDELSDNFILDSDIKNLVIYKGQKFEADNLVSNAVNNVDDNGRIIVSARENDFTISNTTKDLPQKKPEELWNPFVKGNDSRANETGSGIGLAIAKRIFDVHKIKAKIEYEDTQEKLFKVHLS